MQLLNEKRSQNDPDENETIQSESESKDISEDPQLLISESEEDSPPSSRPSPTKPVIVKNKKQAPSSQEPTKKKQKTQK